MTVDQLSVKKYSRVLFVVLLITAGSCMILPALGATTDTGTVVPEIAIASYQLDPAILMPGDAGTLKVKITNTGDEPVAINRVELLSDHLKVTNYQTYDKVGNLGPGNSLEFTFMLDAGQTDGMYFPIFYVDFTNDGSMRYPIPVKVDSTDIVASVVSVPTSFSPGNKEEVTLSIGNIRDNEINSVNIIPRGEGIQTTQSGIFVGTMEPDEQKDVTFEVIANQPTDLSFDISWRNGANEHNMTLTLPVTMGDRNVAADLVVNNLEVTPGAYITIKGDVTNAGLKDAKSVTVTPGKPAQPVDPNPIYVIGALKPDDFSSFEVTCVVQGNTATIPLNVEYRDDDGNMFQTSVDVSMRTLGNSSGSSAGSQQQSFSRTNRGPTGFGSFGSGFSRIPFLEISIIIILGVVGVIAWRKGYAGRIRDRLKKKPER
jgi:hypothetical protein